MTTIVKISPYNFQKTLDIIMKNIQNANLTIFTVIDHQQNALTKNLILPPTTNIVFGNIEVGTKLMMDNIDFNIYLPLKISVYENEDQTYISYLNLTDISKEYPISDITIVQNMNNLLANLTNI
ncbi:MAG: DUF302 domain-containing protein [Erysipelotrichaceae bacterium]